MRILVINQFFWPDAAPTGQLLTDLIRDIDPDVHQVTVLCGASSYGTQDKLSSPPQVKIVRAGRATFSRSRLGRLASYASFFGGAFVRALGGPKPELVLTLTTPPLISLLGTLLKIVRGSRHFIWEMDLYPDIAVELSVLKPRSILTRLIGAMADFSRRRADGIIVLGDDMKARLLDHGIPEHKIVVAENWADGKEILSEPFEDGPLVVHYSGNFGLAHEEHTVTETIRQLCDDSRLRFVFSGGGSRRERLQNICRAGGITTAEFRPYVRRSELSHSLAEGHIGLVTQMPGTIGAVVPSKIYGIMAAGRPVLYIGPRGSTPSNIIEQHECGWRIEPGDTAGVVQLLKRLEQNRTLVREAGARARNAFEKYYDKPIGVARILSTIGISASPSQAYQPVLASPTHQWKEIA